MATRPFAIQVAIQAPERVKALALSGPPLHPPLAPDAPRRKPKMKPPPPPKEDGSHLTDMWGSTYRHRAPGQTLEMVGVTVAEKQRAGSSEWWAIGALSQYDLAETLLDIRRPVALIIPGDSLQSQSRAAAELLGGIEVVERPQWGYGIFDTQIHK